MGKSKIIKPYVFISGLALRDNNRGTAALGYGAISFLKDKGLLCERQTIIDIKDRNVLDFAKWVLKFLLGKNKTKVKIDGVEWTYKRIVYPRFEKKIIKHRLLSKLTFLHRIVNKTGLVAAINGGDGFSDIYGKKIFLNRLPGINFAMEYGLPLVILPQTIGPFCESECLQMASNILRYAKHVYVRDECFISELKEMGVQYELTNDLSFYMKPEPWDIEIDTKNAVGINVSGLAYDNNFHTLAGQFPYYQELMEKIVMLFQGMGKQVYLISHSFNYNRPEPFNDDLSAAKELYAKFTNKQNVHLVDRDLISPQVKYLISRMSFFVGTRMHANFAAIFTNVPLFGLAYSYKFKGAFENNGIYNRVANIRNMTPENVDLIVKAVESAYYEDVNNNN